MTTDFGCGINSRYERTTWGKARTADSLTERQEDQTSCRLEDLLPAPMETSMSAFSAEDVLRLLGRKLHGNF
jgi:hypothetical protein